MVTKEKIRRFRGTLLTAALTVPLLFAGRGAATAQAAEPQAEAQVAESESFKVPGDSMLPDNDELFAGYVMQAFYGGGAAPLSDYGEVDGVLNQTEKAIYEELRTAVGNIAAGQEESTQVSIQAELGITWATDLTGDALRREAETKFKEAVDLSKIVDCLMVDCPYELYWFDKEVGHRREYMIRSLNGQTWIDDLKISFTVARAYAAVEDYKLDQNKIQKIPDAVRNARKIMSDNAGKPDYEKLKVYKKTICDLTDYNNEAADKSYTGGYGDPWQMIYVFDGDPATKVVCEGYSKAFQYLCDISEFEGEVTCYTVTGYMGGGTGAGGHMWNIVTLEGKNYMVDVTNSDAGNIGQDGELFLAGTSGSVEQGYEFQIGEEKISYTYKDPLHPEKPGDAVELYGREILTLADHSYAQSVKPKITEQPKSQTVTYGARAKAMQVSAQGAGSLSYQWYQDGKAIEGATASSYQPPQVNGDGRPGLDAGEYHYQCKVACKGETTVSEEAVLTVEPSTLSPVVTKAEHTDKVYDGTSAVFDEQGIEVKVKGSVYAADDITLFYTLRYNKANVEEADAIIIELTLEGEYTENYRVERLEIPGRITPKPVSAEAVVKDKEYDGMNTATITDTVLYGILVGDDVELTTGTAAFAAADVGNNIPVYFTGFGLSGKDASNYILEKQPDSVTASITEVKKPGDKDPGTNPGNVGTNPPAGDKKKPSTEKTPGRAALASVKASGGKKLTIKWKKMTGASGYEVQCCLKKNFKSGVKKALAKKGNKTSLVIKKLKKGKTYYVRIRAYKTVKINGKTQKLYGAWSKAKKSKKIK